MLIHAEEIKMNAIHCTKWFMVAAYEWMDGSIRGGQL